MDGGAYSGGRHTRGAGFERDLEKLNSAALAGFLVIRATPGMVGDGRALHAITAALRMRGLTPMTARKHTVTRWVWYASGPEGIAHARRLPRAHARTAACGAAPVVDALGLERAHPLP